MRESLGAKSRRVYRGALMAVDSNRRLPACQGALDLVSGEGSSSSLLLLPASGSLGRRTDAGLENGWGLNQLTLVERDHSPGRPRCFAPSRAAPLWRRWRDLSARPAPRTRKASAWP